MAREIEIQVTAETRQAERSMESLDQGIKRVEADLGKLEKAQQAQEKAAQKAADAAERQAQKQSALTGAVAGFLTAGAIVGAVKSTMDWAGAIQDLSTKTGISTTMIQKFATAAGDSGVSVERIAQSVQMMSDRLASGDKSAVAAVKSLGLSMQTLLSSSPDQAFLMIAGAVGKIEDPMQRAKLAADLFGRSGLDLVKVLNRDFVDAVDKVNTVSTDTIKKWDDVGDSWGRAKVAGKGLLAEVLSPFIPVLDGIAAAAQTAAKWVGAVVGYEPTAVGLGGSLASGARNWDKLKTWWTGDVGMPGALKNKPLAIGAGFDVLDVTSDPKLLNAAIANLNAQAAQTKESTRQQARFAKASQKAAEALEAHASAVTRWNNIVGTSDWLMARSGQAAMGYTPETGGLGLAPSLTNSWGGVANTGIPWGPTVPNAVMGYRGSNINPAAYASGGRFNWGGLLNLVGGGASLFGGNNIVGQAASGALGGAALGGGVSSMMSSIVGASVWGPLAPIGAAVGAAIPFVKKLFGPSKGAIAGKEADQRIGQLQAGLLGQYGSLDTIAGMGSAGAALAAGWGSKNVTGEANFRALIAAFEEQNALLAEQKDLQSQIASIEEQRKALAESLIPTYAQVTEAANVLGINVDALGPKVAQLGATESWTGIINALETIIRATGDVGGSLEQASGKISAMVQQAIKAGTEIPANMKPYIEELIRSGKLLDENGQAITDMTQIKFGAAIKTQAEIIQSAMDALDTSLQKIVGRLDEIANKLAGIPGAAATAGTAVNGIPDGERGDPYVPMASGGIVTRPTRALIGEAGPEAVIPLRRAMRPTIVQVMLDGRVLAESMARHQADLLPEYGV